MIRSPSERVSIRWAALSRGTVLAAGLGLVSVVEGLLVVIRPQGALALAIAIALAGVVVAARDVSIGHFVLGWVVIGSAFVSVPRAVQLGPVSGQAWLSILYVALGVTIIVTSRSSDLRGLGWSVVPTVLFVGWALITLFFNRPTAAGAQNLIVLAAFPVLIVSGAVAVRTDRRVIAEWDRFMKVAAWIAGALYAGSVAVSGFGGRAVISPRPFALFGLVLLAWALGVWRYGSRRLGAMWTAALLLLIFSSLSRTALATAGVMVALAWIDPRSFRAWFRSVLLIVVVAAGLIIVFTKVSVLSDRFTQGDVKQVAGLQINTSGREQLWATTWNSFLTSPVVGHGAGAADNLIQQVYGAKIGHPHNDYLRLLNDFGAIGAILWGTGFVVLMIRCWRAWQRRSDDLRVTRLHMGATLSLLAVALTMITDNVVIYAFAMAPVALMVGMSIGMEQDRGAEYWRRVNADRGEL